ncbi:unnamed protein product [Phyllotreta striolata]|uniref:Uncharacterized protein n=1 Tax=Phyllotreta striolata TaxID=444603 RepID=A0A9N9XLD2_PHYSR|nr:unnamed protein product [Phyllotreta striolata]
MKVLLILSVLLISSLRFSFCETVFTIEDTNVSTDEGVDAIEALEKIWNTFDTTEIERVKLFCSLFNEKHTAPQGWNVIIGDDYTVYFSNLATSYIDVKMISSSPTSTSASSPKYDSTMRSPNEASSLTDSKMLKIFSVVGK